jgi:alpha-ribazole phosphatase/probable phosphoglycerate mutase
MTPTRLILVRHAEPDESVRGRCYGRLDVDLCPDGLRHADELAAELERAPVTAVYTSGLLRARATATPIAERLGLEPVVVDELRELDFGELDGLPLDDIAVRFPELLAWTETPSRVQFPGGESVAELRRRVLAAVLEIRRRHRGQTVVVVSHALPIRAVLAEALELPDDHLFRIGQDYGRFSVVDWFDEVPVVRLVNAPALRPSL